MTASDPYSRVYWQIVDDPKFADVYSDDHSLALWVRLLITADAMWPASGVVPIGTRRAALDKLVSTGLVDLGTGGRFRIHGLDSERAKRQQHASNAAGIRWASGEHPASNAQSMPRRDETRRDEKRLAELPPSNANGTFKKAPTDEDIILAARAVMADRMASDDQKRIARDALIALGVQP